jgi:hypothetical protein
LAIVHNFTDYWIAIRNLNQIQASFLSGYKCISNTYNAGLVARYVN